jgi:predicted Fe-S protein YdhL (DUF1289 family)
MSITITASGIWTNNLLNKYITNSTTLLLCPICSQIYSDMGCSRTIKDIFDYVNMQTDEIYQLQAEIAKQKEVIEDHKAIIDYLKSEIKCNRHY